MRHVARQPRTPVEPALPHLTAFAGDGLEPRGDYEALDFVDRDFSGGRADDARFLECRLLRCRLDGASFRGARIIETVCDGVLATTADLTDSTWRDTRIVGGRLGAVTLIGAAWRDVTVRDCHLGFVNLAGAEIEDVVFERCEIGGLDVRTAQLRSITFVDCRIDELTVVGATLAKVDLSGARLRSLVGVESLRGAIVSDAQLVDLAPILAAELGLEVRPVRSDDDAGEVPPA